MDQSGLRPLLLDKCPVIFMTANDDQATRNEATDAGCIAYLRKPFEGHVLLDVIRKAAA